MRGLRRHYNARNAAFLALALACTIAVYFKLPRVFFYGDDFASLLEVEDEGFFHFVLRPVGSHMNLLRQGIFASMFKIFGFRPEPHGWFTLAIHLLNVSLAFQVILRMT